MSINRSVHILYAGPFVLYFIAFFVFFNNSLPLYSDMARFLGFGLFVLGTWPMFRFLRNPQGLPLIEIVLLNYVLFFSLPLFYHDELVIYIGTRVPNGESIELTLICAMIGIVMLQLGYRFFSILLREKQLPQLRFSSNERHLFVFAVLTLIGRLSIDLNLFRVMPDFERFIGVILSGDFGIALLSLIYYRGSLTRVQRFVTLSILLLLIVSGLISGMTQNVLQPFLIWFLCRWFAGRGVPYRQLATIVVVFLLLQPVKANYRMDVWFSGKDFSFIEKVETYVGLLLDHWLGQGDIVDKAGESTAGRLSLLLQTAHLVENTPSMAPYQNGKTLTYLVYTWIPRFLWPNKPIAQQTNIDFATNYGIQSPSFATSTRFGIGHLGEAYINFGVIGVFIIFFCLGGLYCLPFAVVSVSNDDIAALAILSAVLSSFIFIESTIGHVFGGTIQQVLVQSILVKLFCTARAVK